MAGFWLISERENWRRFGIICNKTGRNNLLEPRMDTNRREYPRRRFHEFSQMLFGVIQSVLIREIRVCKVNDLWSFVPPSIKDSDTERAFPSSPRDAGVGRGLRRGAFKGPPLPGPLLHPMEEREYPRLRLCRAESIR